MELEILRQVRERAEWRCKYCRLLSLLHPAPFQIDHIISRQHGGRADLDNLAFACIHCNRHKGPNKAGIDPVTGELTRLFHPRTDEWQAHFRWEGMMVLPLTAVGRVTVIVLFMNHPEVVWLRSALAGDT